MPEHLWILKPLLNTSRISFQTFLAAHCLMGCDTVAKCHGIGKRKMLKTLKMGISCLNLQGEQSADFEEVLQQSTAFISACYGIHDASSMTASRIKVWMMKTGSRESRHRYA